MTHQQQLRLDMDNDFVGHETMLNAKPFVDENTMKNKSLHITTTTMSRITTRVIEPAGPDVRDIVVPIDNTSSPDKVMLYL